MQNRDKVIKEVAAKLNFTQKAVKDVVAAQALLAKTAMSEEIPRSVYFRKVGTLLSSAVRAELKEKKQIKIDIRNGKNNKSIKE